MGNPITSEVYDEVSSGLKNEYLASYLLRPYYEANPNREKDGSPKITSFNDIAHGVISGACCDYHLRRAMCASEVFRKAVGNEKWAERTRHTHGIIVDIAVSIGAKPQEAQNIATNLMFCWSAKSETNDSDQSAQLIIQFDSVFEGLRIELRRVKNEDPQGWKVLVADADAAVIAHALDTAGLNESANKKIKKAVEQNLTVWQAKNKVHANDIPAMCDLVAKMKEEFEESGDLSLEGVTATAKPKRGEDATPNMKNSVSKIMQILWKSDKIPSKYIVVPPDVALQGNIPINNIYPYVFGALATHAAIQIEPFQPVQHLQAITDTRSRQGTLVPLKARSSTRYSGTFLQYHNLNGAQLLRNTQKSSYDYEMMIAELIRLQLQVSPGAMKNKTAINNMPMMFMVIISPQALTCADAAFQTPPPSINNQYGQAAADQLLRWIKAWLPSFRPSVKPMVFAPTLSIPEGFTHYDNSDGKTDVEFARDVAKHYAKLLSNIRV